VFCLLFLCILFYIFLTLFLFSIDICAHLLSLLIKHVERAQADKYLNMVCFIIVMFLHRRNRFLDIYKY
jgi:hypothetical protein